MLPIIKVYTFWKFGDPATERQIFLPKFENNEAIKF